MGETNRATMDNLGGDNFGSLASKYFIQQSGGAPAESAVNHSRGGGLPMQSIYDKTISGGKKQVSLAAFSWLFSEIVQYSQIRVESVQELESRSSLPSRPHQSIQLLCTAHETHSRRSDMSDSF